MTAFPGEGPEGALGGIAADRIEHHVDCFVVVCRSDIVTPCFGARIDQLRCTAITGQRALGLARGGRNDIGAKPGADLHRRQTGRAARTEHEQALACLELGPVDKRVPGGCIADHEHGGRVE